jgi:hypothetical protein
MNTFQIVVAYPNGERKGEVYPFDDKDTLQEGIGTLALIHLNGRDDIRRTFEVVRVSKEEEVADAVTTDPPSGADPAGG